MISKTHDQTSNGHTSFNEAKFPSYLKMNSGRHLSELIIIFSFSKISAHNLQPLGLTLVFTNSIFSYRRFNMQFSILQTDLTNQPLND